MINTHRWKIDTNDERNLVSARWFDRDDCAAAAATRAAVVGPRAQWRTTVPGPRATVVCSVPGNSWRIQLLCRTPSVRTAGARGKNNDGPKTSDDKKNKFKLISTAASDLRRLVQWYNTVCICTPGYFLTKQCSQTIKYVTRAPKGDVVILQRVCAYRYIVTICDFNGGEHGEKNEPKKTNNNKSGRKTIVIIII